MIRAANDSGADLIKGQAFLAKDITSGSMPQSFYEDCAFSVDQYLELIEYARSIGNDLFYSIFSDGMERISFHQRWHKIAGAQTKSGKVTETQDIENMVISIPSDVPLSTLPNLESAQVLYVSKYLPADPQLEYLTIYSRFYKRSVGYSDHTVGIKWCLEAIHKYNVHVIEKHFCLNNYESYEGVVFRDSIHGVGPKQFEKLALALSA